MPQVALFIAGAVSTAAGTLAAGSVGAFLTTNVIGRLLTTVAITALARAVAPKPQLAVSGIRSEQTLTGGTTPASFILGRYATEGQLVAPPMSHGTVGGTPNAWLTYVIELGDIAGQTLESVIINGEPVTLGATPDPDYGLPVEGKFAGYAWVKYYDGTQTVADPMLVDKYGSDPDRPWAADMIGAGINYAICTFRLNRELFSSFPAVRFVMGGIPLYDPRKDTSVGGSGTHRWADPATWEASENPGVQWYNILRGITLPGGDVWGGQAAADDLPLSDWFAAMNAADAPVTLSAGGSEPAYRSSYEVFVADEPASVMEEIGKACSGQIAEVGGIWKPQIGAPRLPVFFLTDDDLNSHEAGTYDPFPAASQVWNGVQASYPAPDALWQSSEAPPLYNATYEAEDDGQRHVADLALPAAPYPDQVQRLMRAYVEDNRRMRRHSLTLPPDAIPLEPLDTLSWTSAVNGYGGKAFEIAGLSDPLVLSRPRASLRERDGTDYDWAVGYEVPVSFPPTTLAPAVPYALASTSWSVAAASIEDAAGGARRPALLVTWSSAGLDGISGLTHEVRVQATAAPVPGGIFGDIGANAGVISEGILPATTYEVRLRPIATGGRAVSWTAWKAVTTDAILIDVADLDQAVWDQVAVDAGSVAAGLIDDFDTGTFQPWQTSVIDAYGPLSQPVPLADRIAATEAVGATNAGDIERIDTDLIATLPVVGSTQDDLDALSEAVTALQAHQIELGARMANAGIHVDPDSGEVRLEAYARITDGFADLQLQLDASQAEISTRVTYSTMADAIAEAVLDPTALLDFTGVNGRLSSVETTLNGLDGVYAAISITAEVTDQGTRLTAAEQNIDSLQQSITTKVETTTFNGLEGRVTQTEQKLDTYDGAAFTQSVIDARGTRDALDDLAQQQIIDLLAGNDALADTRAQIAYARQDFHAITDDLGVSLSSLNTEVGAFQTSTAALFANEITARADGDAALTRQITSLIAVTDDQAAQIDEINNVSTDSTSGNAAALAQLQLDVNGSGGVAQAVTAVEGRVTQTEDGLQVAVSERGQLLAGVADADDLAAEAGLRGILAGNEAARIARDGISEAREDLSARVSEGLAASAQKITELTAALATTNATLDDVLTLSVAPGSLFGQWWTRVEGDVYDATTGLSATHGLVQSVVTLSMDPTSLFGQWYNKVEGDLYDPATGFAAVSGTVDQITSLTLDPDSALAQFHASYEATVNDPVTGLAAVNAEITELNTVSASSTSALTQAHVALDGQVNDPATGLPSATGRIEAIETVDVNSGTAIVQRFTALEGAVNDPATGLVAAWASIDSIETLTVSPTSALGTFRTRVEAQIGGDGSNLVPDAAITTTLYWTLGTGWSMISPTANARMTSVGVLKYDPAADPGIGWGSAGQSGAFPVVQGQVYAAVIQAQASGDYRLLGRIHWFDKDDVEIAQSVIVNALVTADTTTRAWDVEAAAPVNAKSARVQACLNRDDTAGSVFVGGFSVERVGAALAKTRGDVTSIIDFTIDPNSALFTRLDSVTTEVFTGPDSNASLRATTQLLQTSQDGIKAGWSLLTDNNGHISGVKSTSDLAEGGGVESALLFAADKVFFVGETYAVGTVGVTNGSTGVTGSGTAWAANVAPGDWFTGPDGRTYQVTAVNSNTSLAITPAYAGATASGQTYGVSAGEPLLTIHAADTVVNGVLVPKGVYIADARIRNGQIDRAKIADSLQSDNYAEDASGLPTAGMKLDFANGSAKLAGPVISRNIVLNSGSFTYAGSVGAGGAIDIPFVNTGIRIGADDVWATSKRVLAATVRVSPASAGGAVSGSLWRAKAEVYNAFAWFGATNWDAAKNLQHIWSQDPANLVTPAWASGADQRVLMDIHIATSLIAMNGPITIDWKVYEVT